MELMLFSISVSLFGIALTIASSGSSSTLGLIVTFIGLLISAAGMYESKR